MHLHKTKKMNMTANCLNNFVRLRMTGGLGPRCAFEWVTTVVAKNAVKSQEWRTASMIGLLSSGTVRLIRKYIYFAQ